MFLILQSSGVLKSSDKLCQSAINLNKHIKMKTHQSVWLVWNDLFVPVVFYKEVTRNWESMNGCNQLLISSCCSDAGVKQNHICRKSGKWGNPTGCWCLVIRRTFLIWQPCWLDTLSDSQLYYEWASGVLMIMLHREGHNLGISL